MAKKMKKLLTKLGFVKDTSEHDHALQESWKLEFELLAEGRREEAEKVRIYRWNHIYQH